MNQWRDIVWSVVDFLLGVCLGVTITGTCKAAALAFVEPDPVLWPYAILAILVAGVAGLIVLRIKRPETFSRVAREAGREVHTLESLSQRFKNDTVRFRNDVGSAHAPPPTPTQDDGILR